MRTEHMAPDELVPSARHRGICEDAVTRLMESISRIGLQTPPTARYVANGDGELIPVLVAGAHRTEACKRLGIAFIAVQVMDASDTDARLWEISENLHRAELSPVERAEHIEEWRSLTEANARGGNIPPLQPHDAGVKKVARELGIDPKAVRNATKIAALPQKTRDQARKERWPASKLLKEASPKRTVVIGPTSRNDDEATEAQVGRLMGAWNAAAPEAREKFARRVNMRPFA